MRGTKTLKIAKNCTKNMKNCKKLQKIAKLPKKYFSEGQLFRSDFSTFWKCTEI